MQKRALTLVSLVLVLSILSVSFVSAGWFGDIWGKVVGSPVCTEKCGDVTIQSSGTLDFGGMFSYYDWPNTKCHANPATGACSCPDGYTAYPVSGEANVDNTLMICARAHTASSYSALDFGGIYAHYYPYTASSCYANPATGACSCPDGYTATNVMSQANIDNTVILCSKPHSDSSSSALDFGGGYGGYGQGQIYKNPSTNAASCPSGYTATKFRFQQNLDNPSWFCSKTHTTSTENKCETVCTPDTTAPVISEGSPSGTLSTRSSVTLQVKTNEDAKCAYAPSDLEYYKMNLFFNTGNLTHSQEIKELVPGDYQYYIKCKDYDGNINSAGYLISFSISENNTQPPSSNECVDSDGGLNYYVKGKTSIGTQSFTDLCTGNDLTEYICDDGLSNDELKVTDYTCPNGCLDGACLKSIENPVCQNLINIVANPTDRDVYGRTLYLSYNSSYKGTWYIKNVEEKYTQYGAGWYTNDYIDEQNKYFSLDYSVYVFENKDINLSNMFLELLGNNICIVRDLVNSDGTTKNIYVCNWDILTNRQSVDSWSSFQRTVFWFKGNVLVQSFIYFGESLSDVEVAKIAAVKSNELLASLQDNRYQSNLWKNFEIPYQIWDAISQDLEKCGSDVSLPTEPGKNTTCYPYWECKLEPVICPEHGYQTRTCRDAGCNTPDKTETISCNPGMCSGCYAPKWFGDKWGDNRCIPYGFKFEQQTGQHLELIDSSDSEVFGENYAGDDYKLEVISADRAIFTIYGRENNYTYELAPGRVIAINISENAEKIDVLLLVDKINYNSKESGNSTVEVTVKVRYMGTVVDTMNAYCDIDGMIKKQKTKDFQGNWAKCQNNYECESNMCLHNECYDIEGMVNQASSFKVLGIKVLCRLSALFKIGDYNSCVAGYVSG